METVLYTIGGLAIAIGGYVAILTIQNLSRMGVSFDNPMAVTAWAGVATFVVIGVLIAAFGTVISLLKDIRRNGERAALLRRDTYESSSDGRY